MDGVTGPTVFSLAVNSPELAGGPAPYLSGCRTALMSCLYAHGRNGLIGPHLCSSLLQRGGTGRESEHVLL